MFSKGSVNFAPNTKGGEEESNHLIQHHQQQQHNAPHLMSNNKMMGLHHGGQSVDSMAYSEDMDDEGHLNEERRKEQAKSIILDSEPQVNGKLLYFIFVLQGCGVLFPWNSFISAPDYFTKIYGESAMMYFSVAYSVPNLLGLLVFTKFGGKIPLNFRVFPAYIVTLLILLSIPIIGYSNAESTSGFIITITFIVFCALCNCFLQSGIFGLASMLPSMYVQAVMVGAGLAGLLCSFLRIVTKLTIEQNRVHVSLMRMTHSTASYFIVCSIIILLCILSFIYVVRHPYCKYYINLSKKKQLEDGNNSNANSASILTVFKKIWYLCLLVMLLFVVTISLFPGLALGVRTWYSSTPMRYWLPILMAASNNIFEFVGRTMPNWIIAFNKKTIAIPVLLRVFFVPLFLFYYRPSLFGYNDYVYDAFPLFSIFLVSISNGYLCSLLMMFAPQCVENNEKEIAGTMMTFFLLFGISIGSNMGLIFSFIV